MVVTENEHSVFDISMLTNGVVNYFLDLGF